MRGRQVAGGTCPKADGQEKRIGWKRMDVCDGCEVNVMLKSWNGRHANARLEKRRPRKRSSGRFWDAPSWSLRGKFWKVLELELA